MHFFPVIGAWVLSASVLYAMTEADACRALSEGLRREAELLASVQDADSAARTVAPLGEVLRELAVLRDGTDDNALWNYIDSTDEVKPELMARIRCLSVQFSRLEKARFYGCRELGRLLAPQLNPA